MPDSLLKAFAAFMLAVLSAGGGVGGTLWATAQPTKPADPAAAVLAVMPQLRIVRGMTGLCIPIEEPKPFPVGTVDKADRLNQTK